MRLLFAHACPLAQTYKWRVREFKEKELSEQIVSKRTIRATIRADSCSDSSFSLNSRTRHLYVCASGQACANNSRMR